MRRKLQMKLVLGGIALVILLLGGVYGYVRIYTKTPEYALMQVQDAIEKHDKAQFSRYVDMDGLLDTSYDSFIAALIETDKPEGEAKAAIEDFARMMKAPLISSFKTAVESFVETGAWEPSSAKDGAQQSGVMDTEQALERTGLKETAFRGMDGIEVDDKAGSAIAKVQVFQKEADDAFVLEVKLLRQDSGDWRVEEITNFQSFVAFVEQARKAKLKAYADATEKIMATHNEAMLHAQDAFMQTLSDGSLGNQETRDALKTLMEKTILTDWQQRKAELEAVDVPVAAQSLQHLRLRICDLHIAYAEGYAAWLTDKKAETIREAERQLKQARTLEQEERFLARRVSGQK